MAESLIMGDIKFYYSPTYCPAEIRSREGDLVRDPGLENAVLISLGTDRQVLPSETPERDRRGWWGDTLLPSPVGSKSWLLDRSKINKSTLSQMMQYDKEALSWMIDDKIASDIQITSYKNPNNPDEIIFYVTITAVAGGTIGIQYSQNWKYQTGSI